MKTLFLDIDGVLNHNDWYIESRKNNPSKYTFAKHEHSHFDPNCVERLNKITTETGANIVVSSTWRKGKTLLQLQELLGDVGVTGEIIDTTPALYYKNSTDNVQRGSEIHEWVRLNKNLLETETHLYKDYVIIDDDSDMLYRQKK